MALKEYTAIISCEAVEYIPRLETYFDVLEVKPDLLLQKPVQCHADMIVTIVGNCAVIPERYAIENGDFVKHLEERCGIRVIPSSCDRGAEYPRDVAFNVLTCGSFAFSLKKHTSHDVADMLNESGYTHVNVRQGYAACSSLACDSFIITADPAVEKGAVSVGLDVMRICEGHIRLEGYSTGFIGGASGVCGNTVYFLGNIFHHPDGKKIREYIYTHGYDIVCLSDGELCDLGGIKFVKNIGCKA